MNREEFVHNIDNIQDVDIISAFDNLMAMYCLCNGMKRYGNISISDISKVASFDITFDNPVCDVTDIYAFFNPEDAYRSSIAYNNISIPIYGINYTVSCELNMNVLHIQLQQ